MPANASPATTAPEVIGPYRILGRIGSGGMGIVYRARHWVTGQEVALKTVKVPDEAHLASIRREIRALARVRHPGVVRIVSEGVEAGLPWCAMELCEGRSLRQILQESLQSQAISDPRAFQPTRVYRPTDPDPAQAETEAFDRSSPRISGSFPAFPGPRPAGDAGDLAWKLTLLKRLCAPLAYLHGEGIVHCDLKPDNILVRPSGYPVLVDFGLMALFAGKLGRETLDPRLQVVGTAWYMAPEQVSGELFDARVDLYALGCILYEAITGQPPFVGLTPYEVLTQHSSTTAPPPSRLSDGVPPELDALAARLLEKKPRHRIGYAEDVAALLGRMAGAGITVADDRWDAPAPRPYLYRPGFAGRDETMHELRRHIARLRTGAGALTIVGGESGAGTTRLALAVAGESLRLQTPVVTQECPPPSVSRQSGPVDVGGPLRGFGKALEIVADRCRERGASEVERLLGPAGQRATVLAACAPALAGLGEGKAEDLPPDAARVRLLTYLAQTLRELCDREPLLLVIDDLQWADELTLDALAFLVRSKSLDDMPLAILALHRSDDRVERIAALRGLPGVRAFDLGRLDARAVGKQARDMLAMDAVPEGLAEFLARQSEGNPFFVAEYLRTAVAEGSCGATPPDAGRRARAAARGRAAPRRGRSRTSSRAASAGSRGSRGASSRWPRCSDARRTPRPSRRHSTSTPRPSERSSRS
ncbi:MAG: protein kinase [Acidobacteriota bacterium]